MINSILLRCLKCQIVPGRVPLILMHCKLKALVVSVLFSFFAESFLFAVFYTIVVALLGVHGGCGDVERAGEGVGAL